MIPPWLTIGIWVLGLVAFFLLVLWSLCAIAKDADEILSARDRRQQHPEPARDELQIVRERRRSHARNGIGGAA